MPTSHNFHKVTVVLYTDRGGNGDSISEFVAGGIASALGDEVLVDEVKMEGMDMIHEVALHSEPAAAWLTERWINRTTRDLLEAL